MILIEIRGFQSIDHARIEVEGFTALVGRSNVGKSAIVRAVKAALTNATGTSFVRHNVACARKLKGTKTCKCSASVHLQMPGLELHWEKGDESTEYKINGNSLTAVERGAPEFLAHHGLSPVKLGENKRLLQVADQFFPVFLLDQAGATVANVLSDVARLDAVNLGAKLVEKDRKAAASLRKTREVDVQELSAKLGTYDGLDHAETLLVDVETRLEGIQDTEAKKAEVESFLFTVKETVEALKRVGKVEEIQTPTVTGLQAKQEVVLAVSSLHERYLDQGRSVKTLAGVEVISSPNISNIVSLAADALQVSVFHGKLVDIATTIKNVRGVELLSGLDADPLRLKSEVVVRFEGWADRLTNLKTCMTSWKPVAELAIPDTDRLSDLAIKVEFITDKSSKVLAMESSILKLKADLDEIDKEAKLLASEVKAFGVCPTCARPIHAGDHKELLNGQGRLHIQD